MSDAPVRPRLGLGIDAGGTATRWCLADMTGAPLASGALAPMTGHVYPEQIRRRMSGAIVTLAAAVRTHGAPTGVFAGITGLDAGTKAAEFCRAELAAAFGLGPAAVVVDNDMGLAYRAAFDLGSGILVYSGTGSVACHLTADGTHVRAGGHGVIIDDAGSGFWIAKEAIKSVLRREDRRPGTGWTSPLGQALAAAVGEGTWNAVRTLVYTADRGDVALLAKPVADAASAGDADAASILDAAGRELADLAAALLGRLGARPVTLAGGTSHLHPRIAEAFASAMPGVVIAHERLDPARAGACAAARLGSADGR
jgi:N-acetylglucosamine kinase-like BadF-type ATPase